MALKFFSEPATKTPSYANVRTSFSCSTFFYPKEICSFAEVKNLRSHRFERTKEMVCQIKRESWVAGERDIVDTELHQVDNRSSSLAAGNGSDPCSPCNHASRQMEVGREEC